MKGDGNRTDQTVKVANGDKVYSLPIYDSISYRVSHSSELINQCIQREIKFPLFESS